MHKFNLEIELENKDCCVGCPCLLHAGCRKYELDIKQNLNMGKGNFGSYPRPTICKVNDKEATK